MDSLLKKQTILIFLFALFFFGLVLAAGGGGGGGSSGGGSSGGGSGTGPHLTGLKCTDAGQLTFDQKPAITPVVVEKADGTTITLQGTWDGTKFTSEEAEIREAGAYTIADSKNGDKTVVCPKFMFSCKIVSVQVTECQQVEQGLEARFTVENAPAEDLQFSFVGTKLLKYQKEGYASELRNLKISPERESYRVNIPGLQEIKKIEISHPLCVGQYYVYAQKACTSHSPAAESGQQLKCGGYLDINDRVKCRVSLRKEQAKEYENFFPEECRSWKNQDQCVALYQKVQDCWERERGSQVACLRQKVGVLDVAKQKAACAGDKSCVDKLRQDTYTLVKLRLYHLEEEAEELQEEEKITEDQLVAFVVQMEQSKLAFNEATTKDGRKAVILQAQKYWQELLQKVKG